MDKVERAINGSVGAQGSLVGGVGKEATPEAIIAEYDRLGGLIVKIKPGLKPEDLNLPEDATPEEKLKAEKKLMKMSYKVKTGSFYDFKKGEARAKPQVLLVFRDLYDNEIEIPEDEPIPLEVRAAEAAKEKGSKKKAGKKKAETDEDEGDAEDEE